MNKQDRQDLEMALEQLIMACNEVDQALTRFGENRPMLRQHVKAAMQELRAAHALCTHN